MKLQLADKILDKMDVDILELVKHRYSLKDDQALVEEIADILDVNTDPIQKIHELDDSPEKIYVWDTSMTDEQINEFANRVQKEFVKKYNRDPYSLHFIRNDIGSIEQLSPEEIRQRVKPFLDQN